MSEIYNVGDLGVKIAMKLNEGNVTMTTVSGIGGDITEPVLASPIKKGDYVKITGDMTVTACAANDTQVLGRVESNPVWVTKPTANKTWGNYTPRQATIDIMGKAVKTVKLEAANNAINVGDSVKPGATTAQTWDKDSTANNSVALAAASASSGAKIPVVFGFYGAF